MLGNTLTAEDAQSYRWFLNGEAIDGATGQTYEIVQSGDYSVQIINSDGCTVISVEQSIILSSVDEFDNVHGVSIIQNPIEDLLEIKFSAGTSQVLSLEVYDISGKLMLSSSIASGSNMWSEDLSALSSGRYSLSLFNADGRSILPFIIAD